MSINIFAIKDSANMTFKNKATGKPLMFADYATVTTNSWEAERIFAMSKSTRAIGFDHSKTSTLSVTMEIFELKMLAFLNGEDGFTTGTTNVFKREVLTASATNTITLTDTPLASSLSIFKLESDNLSHGKEQTVGTPATNPDEYSISAKVVTLNSTTAPEGTKFVVYYAMTSAVTAQTLTFSANKFPKNMEVIFDTQIRDLDGVDKYVQIYYPNVQPQANFTLTLSATEIATLELTFDVYKDSDSDNMATYTIL